MASDFEFLGNYNHSANFRDKSTGQETSLLNVEGSSVELLDGDQVVIPAGGQRVIWSIREQRQIGYA